MLENKMISAVITCYRDGQAIPIMHSRLTEIFKKIGCNYEIIFVNDGSPDNSEEVLEAICAKDPKTTAIFHSRNFSSQNAFTSGMIQSIGDAVVLLDGDLQDPPELVEELAKKWAEGFDVVYGIRVQREANMFLQIAYKLFYRVFQKMSYIKVPVDAGDFSLMDRKVVDALNSMPEKDRFMRGLRAWVGFKQTGVPYKRPERMFGRTTNNLIGNFRWARKGIFSFSYMPLELISYLALIVVALSIVGMLIYLVLYFILPDYRSLRGIPTLIIIILFLGGIQLLCLSIIGEYLGKIFEEVKNRPKFIIKKILNNHRKINENDD
ncbi:MAG: glycosyltransferase [Patescibacteria group bacterium]